MSCINDRIELTLDSILEKLEGYNLDSLSIDELNKLTVSFESLIRAYKHLE